MPEDCDDFSTRLRLVKSYFTKNIVKLTNEFTRNNRGEYNVWQRRFWEHLIRNEKDFENHVNYIHYNPVKHGLVTRVMDWPYSSFHRYVKTGLLPMNWCAEGVLADILSE